MMHCFIYFFCLKMKTITHNRTTFLVLRKKWILREEKGGKKRVERTLGSQSISTCLYKQKEFGELHNN